MNSASSSVVVEGSVRGVLSYLSCLPGDWGGPSPLLLLRHCFPSSCSVGVRVRWSFGTEKIGSAAAWDGGEAGGLGASGGGEGGHEGISIMYPCCLRVLGLCIKLEFVCVLNVVGDLRLKVCVFRVVVEMWRRRRGCGGCGRGPKAQGMRI